MYLNYGTRSDIAFVIRQLSYYNSEPQIRHLHIAKQVLHYLKSIITLGIKLRNNLASHQSEWKYGKLEILEYTNSSYVGNLKDRKLITGYCFFFGEAIVT